MALKGHLRQALKGLKKGLEGHVKPSGFLGSPRALKKASRAPSPKQEGGKKAQK